MKIIADENIPYAKRLFSTLGDVTLMPGREMASHHLSDASILLTRSVTKVNENLLKDSDIEFVGTCTIGTDHIDAAYLGQRGIPFSSAPGCNALGVVQYDLCALAYLNKLDPSLRYAVIGCGNVGGKVYQYLKAIGLDCIGIDPHLNKLLIPDLEPLEAIYDCDVICMHTPRIRSGMYPTESLIGTDELNCFKPGTILLNAGRGECIDNAALLAHLKSGANTNVVLDVWASEPNINSNLFDHVTIGTPHIAGYSFEGRVNGSTMIFQNLASYLGKKPDWIESVVNALREEVFGPIETIEANSLNELVLSTFDIEADHDRLANVLPGLPSSFDLLRKNYFKRREFGHYRCMGDSALVKESLKLGFSA